MNDRSDEPNVETGGPTATPDGVAMVPSLPSPLPAEPVSLSGLDTAFLSLETRSTPMHMVGAFVLDAARADGGYSFERILRLLEDRLPAPFRRRLAGIPFGLDHPVWIDDPDLCVRSHVYRMGAPAPGSEEVLATLVAQIAAQPLDRTRPLWELSVIEGLAEGHVALVFKVHHAVADGVSVIKLLLQLLDSSPAGMNVSEGQEHLPPLSQRTPTNAALLTHALSRLPQRSRGFARLLLDSTRFVARLSGSMILGAARKAAMPMPFTGPHTRWNGATSPQRTVGYGNVSLADVKLVSSAFGTSVNHVVLAACTQTLRTYLASHGGVPDSPLVAAIPMSLRSPEDPGVSGNRLSALLVHLPVHLADPVAQLLALRQDSASSMQQHASLGVTALGEWAEFISPGLLGVAARFYADRKLAGHHIPFYNLTISNVRGPATPVYAAGARVTAAYPLGPLLEGAGINITVVSYAGSVDFGVIACERSVPDVAAIALGFGAAVADLHRIALAQKPTPTRGERLAVQLAAPSLVSIRPPNRATAVADDPMLASPA